MTHFIAIVHKDPKSAYGISFPDLPECFSAADTADQILPNAMEALEFFAEDGLPLPAPSTIETVQKTVADELSAGAFLIAVPLIINTKKSARVNITLDKGLLAAIDDAATQRKMTRSGFLAQAAEREIAG